MMKRLLPILLMAIPFLFACERSESKLKAVDRQELEDLMKEIHALANSETCTNPEEWSFTAVGSKACGGPQTYIAYPNSIDTVKFLALVKEYTAAEDRYNKKHEITSDCMFVMPPDGVQCQDGKAVLIYNNLQKLE